MDVFADAIKQNLPEMLARDLAKSGRVFRTKRLTAGPPASSLASENQPPEVPQRNPGRAATNLLHRTTSEAALCPHQDSTKDITDTAREYQRGCVDKDAEFRYYSIQDERQGKTMDDQYTHMNQGNDKGKARVLFNGLDEGWGSDSSADVEAGRSSPSVRIRKQSVTTAATSVEAQSVVGIGLERAGCASPLRTPINQGARNLLKGVESWVDFGPESNSEEEMSGAGASTKVSKHTGWPSTQPGIFSDEEDRCEQLDFVSIPRRRSSLSHQTTTVVLGETAHTHLSSVSPTLGQELASQILLPSPQTSSCQLTSPYHPPKDWDDCEAAGSPIVPTSPRQAARKSDRVLNATLQEQPRPVSPPAKEIAPNALSTTCQRQPQPKILNKLRKTQSHSKMQILTQVQSWLDSSGAAPPGSTTLANPSSPTGMASLTSIRVPAEILENLRISVGNFPDTMLRTSSLTIQTIRSYSRKLKRGGMNNERAFARDSDEIALDALDSPHSAYVSGIDRQPSFGSLKFKKLSLRGRLNLTSRLTSSPTLISPNEEDDFWRDFDDRYPSTRSDTPPSHKSHSDVSACVAALRSIFPNGTDYLLDALYAHIIAYNYINSLCGGFPHLKNDGVHRLLRARPSTNFAVPPGVTSRADLELQDHDDWMIRGYEDDVASVASTAVVPKKAASLLGLGATNMGKPVKPRPGSLGGRKAQYRKTTPPAASFSVSLESEAALRDLRDAISVNIHRLLATVKSAASSASRECGEDDEDDACVGASVKEMEPTLLRALCEIVRCYEELS
ncbi:hypothetical protein VP1G_03414 [Cytospora mali]|uniref:Uncharacterized protein n=1 Tax=Cytospora mali TaxID=578113 RepID=A0A194UWH4_CYTMA|nr:hypothetical protein VP1G_03414 [Valsa mali var. pyri (nom. inval.)]